MRVLSLFSGIGLLDLGLSWAGMQTVGLCEIEPYCREVLAKHWSGVPIWSDVREVTGDAVEQRCGSVDLVAGGFPCQPVSVAGSRKGHSDDRWLWPEMLRVVREVRPGWVLAENVSGLRTLGADTVLSDLEAEGYACWPLVVGARHVGAPHRRDRVWIIARLEDADSGGGRAEDRDVADEGRGTPLGRASLPERRPASVGDARTSGRDCGAALAHGDGWGREGGGLEGGDAASERGRGGASGDEPDRRSEWPVGSPTGTGLEAGRGVSEPAPAQEPQHSCPGDPTLVRGWPARPGEQQHAWEAPRLVAHSARSGQLRAQELENGREGERAGRRSDAAEQSAVPAAEQGQPEPCLGGAVDGPARRLAGRLRRAQLKALGNGVVPQVVAEVGRAILAAEAAMRSTA